MDYILQTYWTSETAVCWAKCAWVYIHWYFYQLRTHKELRKCVKESKQCQEFRRCTHKWIATVRRRRFQSLYRTVMGITAPMTRGTRYAWAFCSFLGPHLMTWRPIFGSFRCLWSTLRYVSVKLHHSMFESRLTFSGGVCSAPRFKWQCSHLFKWTRVHFNRTKPAKSKHALKNKMVLSQTIIDFFFLGGGGTNVVLLWLQQALLESLFLRVYYVSIVFVYGKSFSTGSSFVALWRIHSPKALRDSWGLN